MSVLRLRLAASISKIDRPEIYLLNRFLHTNKEKRIDIDEFISFVPDPPLADLNIEEPLEGHIIYFTSGISKSNVSYYTFSSPKISFKFFEFQKTESSEHNWQRIEPRYINLNSCLLDAHNKITDFHEDIYPDIKILSLKSAPLKSSVHEIKLWETASEIELVNTDISIPETVNYISEFIPEIKKISLLSSNELLHETYVLNNERFGITLQVSPPIIKKLNSLQILNDYPMMDYKNLKINHFRIYENLNERWNSYDVSDDNLLKSEYYNLNNLLQPVYELSDEIVDEILFSFPEYIQHGAKLFYNSPFALSIDSFELSKETQCILAIKMLLKLRAVRKVLIVTSRFQEMNLIFSAKSNFANIWQANNELLLNGFTSVFYKSEGKIFSDQNLENDFIHGISYNTLEESFIKGEFPYEKLKGFDCIIFDDFSMDLFSLDSIRLITRNIKPNFFWILSDDSSAKMETKVRSLYPNSDLSVFKRNKSEINNSHDTYTLNYFLETENNELNELEEIYQQGRKKLDDLVQFGNLLRIQPNAFQIIQDLQKRSNLFEDSRVNVKSEALHYHLQKILSFDKRVLVYSQFEKNGIIEITEMLDKLNIEHIAFRQKDSQKDIDDKIEIIKNNSGKLVYLTNIRPQSIRFKFPDVSYLINYDNWWGPPTRWSLENKLESQNEGITVINYYISNSPESRLHCDLNAKGLNEKNVIETLPTEKFYQLYEDKCWGNYFNLAYDIFKTESTPQIEIESMIDLVNKSKLFMRALGCNYITSQASINNNIYNLSGQILKGSDKMSVNAKCIFSNHLNSDFLKSLIFNMEMSEDKVFIITNGCISYTNYYLPSNISLIDGKQLLTYLELLNSAA